MNFRHVAAVVAILAAAPLADASCNVNPSPSQSGGGGGGAGGGGGGTVQSAESICASDFPDVGFGNAFYVPTTITAYQTEPNLTAAGWYGFCDYSTAHLGPNTTVAYVCIRDDGKGVYPAETFDQSKQWCDIDQGSYMTIVGARRLAG